MLMYVSHIETRNNVVVTHISTAVPTTVTNAAATWDRQKSAHISLNRPAWLQTLWLVRVGVGVGFYAMSFDFSHALQTPLFLRVNTDTYALE